MDPISAAIGAAGNIAGGLMNTSSQQAINTANIQQAQWSATGAYLPQLVKNAEAAGLSPLAVLGQHAPSMPQMISGEPGAGLQRAAAQLTGNPLHQARMDDLAETRAQLEIANARNAGNNTVVQGAVTSEILNRLSQNPNWLPPGWSQPAEETATGIPQMKWLSRIGEQIKWVDPTRNWPSSGYPWGPGAGTPFGPYNPSFGG